MKKSQMIRLSQKTGLHYFVLCSAVFIISQSLFAQNELAGSNLPDSSKKNEQANISSGPGENAAAPATDTATYNKKMKQMANGDLSGRWPVNSSYPLDGAVFPFYRVVAYYGNLFSKTMGILGELPRQKMIKKLKGEVEKWEAADPETPVLPALHYIAVTAQNNPGGDGKYRLRMPFRQVDTILKWSKEINALTFIDVQTGQSTLQEEIPRFKKYFKLPTFHLGIDPEFSMKKEQVPGSAIGSLNADDINYVIDYLADIVKENKLPPKILVIHRFTQDMVKEYKNIKIVPEVQVVIDMDGWGPKGLKRDSYNAFIYKQPVQFSGFKLFYKNDTKNGGLLLTPAELLKLKPQPVYIQYQ